MKTLLSFFVLLAITSIAAPLAVAADKHPSSENYSTVKLFFLNDFLPGGGLGGGGMGPGGMGPGGMGPVQPHFETVKLYLDEKYIGDAMIRQFDVKPQLNLPPGDHTIRIESKDYEKFERTITVLDHGSVQWLVIQLERAAKPKKAAAAAKTKD